MHSLFNYSFYYSLTYFLFSAYSFIFCISAIQIEYIYSVSGEVLYKSFETLEKLNILEFLFIDPPYFYSEQGALSII